MGRTGTKRKPSDDENLLLSKFRSRRQDEEIDTSDLPFGNAQRIRDQRWLELAKTLRCEHTGGGQAGSIVACHLNVGAGGAGLKAGDDQVLFLCGPEHAAMDHDPLGVAQHILDVFLRPRLWVRHGLWEKTGDFISVFNPRFLQPDCLPLLRKYRDQRS
jgi:hypothetical protein